MHLYSKILKVFSLILLMSFSLPVLAQAPFHRGVNITRWFQASGPRQIQLYQYTKKDLEQLKSMGCDVIRLPMNLHAMTLEGTDYQLDPLFLSMLDEVINWTEELGLHLILDNHTFDPAVSTSTFISPILNRVWTQMAEHFKDRSELIYYEILNEPHGISDQQWAQIQQSAIDAIRTVDSKHTIIVGASNWNSYHNLDNLPVYNDNKLIYTFHFYDPFLLTHQGASWVEPSMVPLAGVPFPYNAASMPAMPSSFRNTWLEGAYNNYPSEGTVAAIKRMIDIAAAFKFKRNVPVFCGEFGVLMTNSDNHSRVRWYEEVRKYLEEKGIPWTSWDYRDGFGLFNKHSRELFDHDLNIPLLEALGFKVPPQREYIKRPERTAVTIYDDYIGPGIQEASWIGNNGILDYYHNQHPAEGTYNIYLSEVGRYDVLSLRFKPEKDLSLLATHDYVLEMKVKSNTPGVKFDIRFLDTKTGPDDRPWRMGITIDDSMMPFDGQWHHLQIPLKNLQEKGAWDNAWYNPEGKFDWTAVEYFQIVPEHQDLHGKALWFDNIKLNGEEIILNSSLHDTPKNRLQVYPNPFATHTDIVYQLSTATTVAIEIYNLQGQLLTTLLTKHLSPGKYSLRWDGKDPSGKRAPHGLYILKFSAGNTSFTKKLLLQDQH